MTVRRYAGTSCAGVTSPCRWTSWASRHTSVARCSGARRRSWAAGKSAARHGRSIGVRVRPPGNRPSSFGCRCGERDRHRSGVWHARACSSASRTKPAVASLPTRLRRVGEGRRCVLPDEAKLPRTERLPQPFASAIAYCLILAHPLPHSPSPSPHRHPLPGPLQTSRIPSGGLPRGADAPHVAARPAAACPDTSRGSPPAAAPAAGARPATAAPRTTRAVAPMTATRGSGCLGHRFACGFGFAVGRTSPCCPAVRSPARNSCSVGTVGAGCSTPTARSAIPTTLRRPAADGGVRRRFLPPAGSCTARSARSIVVARIASTPVRTSGASCRCPGRSIASTSSGSSGRLPRTRSDASHRTLNASCLAAVVEPASPLALPVTPCLAATKQPHRMFPLVTRRRHACVHNPATLGPLRAGMPVRHRRHPCGSRRHARSPRPSSCGSSLLESMPHQATAPFSAPCHATPCDRPRARKRRLVRRHLPSRPHVPGLGPDAGGLPPARHRRPLLAILSGKARWPRGPGRSGAAPRAASRRSPPLRSAAREETGGCRSGSAGPIVARMPRSRSSRVRPSGSQAMLCRGDDSAQPGLGALAELGSVAPAVRPVVRHGPNHGHEWPPPSAPPAGERPPARSPVFTTALQPLPAKRWRQEPQAG